MPSLKFVLVAVLCLGAFAFLQAGPIDPPSGPIAPTGRFGPKTDILSLLGTTGVTHQITQSGSYYLSQDLVVTDSAIRIQAPHVTIDLNGFSIIGDGVSGSGIGFGAAANGGAVVIKNGKIMNFGSQGIPVSATLEQIVLEDLMVLDCAGQGINLNSVPARLNNVIANNNGVNGIRSTGRALITNCMTLGNGVNGISATGGAVVSNCTALDNITADLSVTNGLISECVATNITASGGTTTVNSHQP
ncbi:MAG: hypothetical protein AAF581_15220 [Planctomycetota bacterium]